MLGLHLVFVTLFNHVGRFLDLGICQLYCVGPPKIRRSIYNSYNQVILGNMGGVMLTTLFIGTLFIRA